MLILQALYPLKSLPRPSLGGLPKGGLLSPASMFPGESLQLSGADGVPLTFEAM